MFVPFSTEHCTPRMKDENCHEIQLISSSRDGGERKNTLHQLPNEFYLKFNQFAEWFACILHHPTLELGCHAYTWASQVALVVKNLPASTGDMRDESSIPGSGRSPGGGHGTPLQDSCPENSMHRGAWRATVHGVPESQTGLGD